MWTLCGCELNVDFFWTLKILNLNLRYFAPIHILQYLQLQVKPTCAKISSPEKKNQNLNLISLGLINSNIMNCF